DYFFADFVTRVIYRAVPTQARDDIGAPTAFVTDAGGNFGGPVDLVIGPDGALYYVQFDPGKVRRVAPLGGGDQLLPGKKLILKTRPTDVTRKRVSVVSRDAGLSLGGGD